MNAVVVFHALVALILAATLPSLGHAFVLRPGAVTAYRGTQMVRGMTSTLSPDQDKEIRAASTPVEQKGRVTMYKKVGCPHCAKAQELLEGKYGLAVTYVDVMTEGQSEEILQQMRTFSGGRNTVPQVFFNSEHLGGNGAHFPHPPCCWYGDDSFLTPPFLVLQMTCRSWTRTACWRARCVVVSICTHRPLPPRTDNTPSFRQVETVRATPVTMMMDHWFHPWY